MYRLSSVILLIAALSMPLTVLAKEVRLLPVSADDFSIQDSLTALKTPRVQPAGPRGEAVQVFVPSSQDGGGALLQAPENDSRSFAMEVEAGTLASGVTLPLTAPGAIIRLVPLADAASIPVKALELGQAGNRWLGDEGLKSLAPAGAQGHAQSVFGEHTLSFQLSDEIGPGGLRLRARTPERAPHGRYRIHVFEPDSAVLGVIRGERPVVVEGDRLAVETALLGTEGLAIESIEARLKSPSGERFPVKLDAEGEIRLPPIQDTARGLWELEARVAGQGPDGPVRRDVRLAFEGVVPTAALDGRLSHRQSSDGWYLAAGVEVASAGRYELRATLPGVGAAHTARWLAPGSHTLVLRFPGRMPEDALLRDLRLSDQSRLALLHVQAEGVKITPRDRRIQPISNFLR